MTADRAAPAARKRTRPFGTCTSGGPGRAEALARGTHPPSGRLSVFVHCGNAREAVRSNGTDAETEPSTQPSERIILLTRPFGVRLQRLDFCRWRHHRPRWYDRVRRDVSLRRRYFGRSRIRPNAYLGFPERLHVRPPPFGTLLPRMLTRARRGNSVVTSRGGSVVSEVTSGAVTAYE